MSNDNILKQISEAKKWYEDLAKAPPPEVYYLHLTQRIANETQVKRGDIVGTFAGRPVEIAIFEEIINLDEIENDVKTFGEYERFFVHPAIVRPGMGRKVEICTDS